MEERTRELVKVASVIGRSFFDRIIKDVADSIEDVDNRLAYLKNIQLIRERTRMQELEYLFKHALAQEAAYESTLLQQRKALHLKVAQSIENIFRERLGEFYGMLAYHYSKAENLDKAEEYLTKAGEEALRSSASSEALSYFQEALGLYLDKYGDAPDSEKLATFEGSIALAFHSKGQWANAVTYFDRMLSRKGLFSPQNKLIVVLKLTYDVIIVAIHFYLTWNKAGRASFKKYEEPLDFEVKRGEALVFVDSNRFFTEYMGLLRRSCRFDISKTPTVARLWTEMGGILSYLGVSFKLSKRILERTKESITRDNVGHRISYVTMDAIIRHCSGNWSTLENCDEPLVDLALKEGKFWHVINYIWFSCLVRSEQGEFKAVEMLLKKLSDIGAAYDYEGARLFHHGLRCFFLIKVRRLHDAQIEAEAGISYTKQWALDLQQLMFLGQKAQILLFLKDAEEAVSIISKAKELMSRQSLITPVFACQYLVAQFLTDIHLLKQTTASDNHADLSRLRKSAYRSGKLALKNARKYAPFRTGILRLMGDYYWLVGKRRKAMKWYDRSIKEGERLGARPDLSRTYFEVGKRLLEPQSKYKQLNGIDAKGYFEKAEKLFREMGLEKDLEDLERVRLGM